MLRPLSLTIISWHIIISSSLAIFGTTAQIITNIIPIDLTSTILILGTLFINMLSAILMLRGYKIGRILYTLLALTTFYSAFQNKDNLIVFLNLTGGVILAIIFLILLYRENVDQFFLQSKLK
ncbi:MAG: hypothetical protein Q4B95_00410 [Lonepinella koalarum]|nr:hypothetical protein [Lonepinella koalarum]